MKKNTVRRLASSRRRTLVVIVALLALASLSLVSAAVAAPKGDFAPFADCPLGNTAVTTCLFAQTPSGEVTVGNTTVPIANTITLQGGDIENEATGAITFVAAADGNTLSKTPQPVPGGLAGLIKCNELTEPVARLACELVFQNGLTGVTATTELAAPASAIGLNTTNLIFGEGIALSLPVKVKLSNPFLGEHCYIGSNAHPVVIEFTTGTTSPPLPNKPIKGKPGNLVFKDEGNLAVITENSLVNNSFAAPEATGCGGLLAVVVDPLVNAKVGLPAAAGHNTAILNGKVEEANAEAVRASE